MERPLSNPSVRSIVRILLALIGINLLYSLIGIYGIPALLEAQLPSQLSPLLVHI